MTELKLVKDKRKESLYVFLVMLAVFIIKAGIALIQLPIQVNDEVDYLVPGAFLLGLNWEYVFENSLYYGQGFTILLSPLLRVIDNPYVLYRTILMIYVVLETISAMLVFKISRNYLNLEIIYASFVSICVSFCQIRRITLIGDESVITLMIWLITYVVLVLYENRNNRKRKIIFTLVLGFLLAYATTIHTRMISIYAVIFVVILLLFILKKQLIISIIAFFTMPIFYFIAKYYISFIQNSILAELVISEDINNTLESISGRLFLFDYLFKENGLLAFLNTFLGQINTVNIMTGGFFILSSCIAVLVAFKLMSRKDIQDRDVIIAILLCIGFVGFYSLTFFHGITWIRNLIRTINLGVATSATHNSINTSRAFTYLRYGMPYTPPLLLGGFAFLSKYKKNIVLKVSFVLTIMVQLYWLVYTLPYVFNIKQNANAFIAFSLGNYEMNTSWDDYVVATIITIIFSIIINYLISKGRLRSLALVLSLLLIYQYCYYGIVHVNEDHHRGNEGYEFISLVEKTIDIGDEIIVTYRPQAYTYQFMNMDYSVVMEYDDSSELIFCSNMNIEQISSNLKDDNYRCYCLGEEDDEYVFTSNNDIILFMEEHEYEEINKSYFQEMK